LCLCCATYQENVTHLYNCEEASMKAFQVRFQTQLEQALYQIGIPTWLVKTLATAQIFTLHSILKKFQAVQIQQNIGWSWTLMGLLSKEWRHHKSPSDQVSPTIQWLFQIFLELWKTAWDLLAQKRLL